ncbi:hypothetical protein [Nocardia salmonicida]|uniref:hypothetical protein n=1 Tax=Nocardia salmonicida TaxID=53431 RepID=UPI0037B18B0F
MTVIADQFVDVGGHADRGALSFWAPVMRDSPLVGAIITPQYVAVAVETDGSFTTPDFAPGPARVRIGGLAYDIVIPDDPSPIRLWPLIDAGVSVVAEREFVRDGGGVRRAVALPQSEFDAMPTPRDPETIFFTFPG